MIKTTSFDTAETGRSPLGAHIKFIMDGKFGNVIHSTIPPGMVGKPCQFKTIEEYWHILSGNGEIWRSLDDKESFTRLEHGISINIPTGTKFQYRNLGKEPVTFICTAMPPWPGDSEAISVEGPWAPTVE